MSADSNVVSVSVVIAWAEMTTSDRRPWRRANPGLQTTAAAAPHVGGQHCRRVRGPKMCGEARTSSTVTGSRNTAYGLPAACLRDLTEIRANTAGSIPYSSTYAVPAPPKYVAAM